jgi:hypothetical protein
LEKAKSKSVFKAVARRRQQETHSHSHKPSHQRARSRALKAFYAKREQTLLVEIPNIPKSRHPALIKRLKSTGKPKRRKESAKPPKKYAQKPLRAATSSKRKRLAG